MSQSISKVLIHTIFSTKHRLNSINDYIRDELYAYMTQICKNHQCPVLSINGPEDHIHILFLLGRTISQSKILEEVKKGSSKWLKTKGKSYEQFFWQRGYGNFSIDETDINSTKHYIHSQREHHRIKTFKEEYREFLERYNIPYDERYVWD